MNKNIFNVIFLSIVVRLFQAKKYALNKNQQSVVTNKVSSNIECQQKTIIFLPFDS